MQGESVVTLVYKLHSQIKSTVNEILSMFLDYVLEISAVFFDDFLYGICDPESRDINNKLFN